VRNSVQQAFYRALTSQAAVALRQRLLGVTLDAVETAHQLANVGQADTPDVLQAEVEAEQAKLEFVNAQRQFIQEFRTLSAIAGKPELPVSPLRGELDHPPEIETEQQVAKIVSSSPAVKRAQQEVAVAEARLKDAQRESVPDLQLRAGEWWSGEITEGTQRAAGPMGFATAGINVPLWNRNQGNAEAAKADLERAKQDVIRTQLYLRQQSEPLAQQYLASRFEADRYRAQLIPRARRAYELYLMKYQQMAAAYPQVLVSQRTLFQLQIDYLRALSTVWISEVALENYSLSGGLEAPASDATMSTTINLPNGGGNE
jgi:cobalt-zinc-cadmium efflux system outer membrane protein